MAQLFNIKKVTIGPKNLVAEVELAASAPLMTSEDLEATTRVWKVMPDLRDHVCLGDSSQNFGEVMGNTELAHLLEHVAVELLARTNIAGDITSGRTEEIGERTYQITFPCADDVLVVGALSSAVWIMQWAFSGGGDPMPDADATAAGLVDLVKSLPEVEKEEPAEEVIGEEEHVIEVPVADGTAVAAEPVPAPQPLDQPVAPAPQVVAEPEQRVPMVDEAEVDAILAEPAPEAAPAAEPMQEPVPAAEPAPAPEPDFVAEPDVANEPQVDDVAEPAEEPAESVSPVAPAEQEMEPEAAPEPPADTMQEPELASEPEPEVVSESTAEPEPAADPADAPVPAEDAQEPAEEPGAAPAPVNDQAVPTPEPEPAPEPADDWGLGNVPRPRAVR